MMWTDAKWTSPWRRRRTTSNYRRQWEVHEMTFSLAWIPEVLEDAGLKVAEQPGWRTRGRGEMGAVRPSFR
jgi:hypothetical protein